MYILLRFLMIKSILSRVPISSSKRDKNPKDLTLTDKAHETTFRQRRGESTRIKENSSETWKDSAA